MDIWDFMYIWCIPWDICIYIYIYIHVHTCICIGIDGYIVLYIYEIYRLKEVYHLNSFNWIVNEMYWYLIDLMGLTGIFSEDITMTDYLYVTNNMVYSVYWYHQHLPTIQWCVHTTNNMGFLVNDVGNPVIDHRDLMALGIIHPLVI